MKTIAFVILTLSIFLTACEDPAANKPKATTSNVTNGTAAKPTIENPFALMENSGTELFISPETSEIGFTGSKVTGKHDGGFKLFKGIIDLVNGKPGDSKVLVEIDAASVFTDADGLTKHLQTGDFFDVAKYPKASFVSTKIVPDTAKGADNYTVAGDLDLRGQKKSVTFPATIKVSDSDVSVDAEFSINRKDFGIVYAGKADDLIRDDVVIKLDLNAPRVR